ncbi:recombinase family protein [Mesorhizobium sp. B2-1-8]|uniref:recombinase family protein n=1 Tax=Mesorhizobium sp. B2-1-8 TaxID=2589967 RepID=UPI001D0FDA5F|nr:recombinase family protein [Mesorhizobium sp. B2-1-8]UCI17744.1 recombinase family protein [Mesorhizobium sp. B2-1-8]
MRRAALYLRVSTKDQSIENQRLELERVAQAKGWEIMAIYQDEGISGAKGRESRPAFDKMLKDAVRNKFQVLMSWDVSRLGRSLTGLIAALDDLLCHHIDLYLHQQAVDTTTPSGKAMFQMIGVFAEFERNMTSERVKAGLSVARSKGRKLGRPFKYIDTAQMQRDREAGMSIRAIACQNEMSVGKIHRTLVRLHKERPLRVHNSSNGATTLISLTPEERGTTG